MKLLPVRLLETSNDLFVRRGDDELPFFFFFCGMSEILYAPTAANR